MLKVEGVAHGNTTATNVVNNKEPAVHSYTEAIAMASTFDIFGPNSPLCQKLRLNNNNKRTNGGDDKKVWFEFINQSVAVDISNKRSSSSSYANVDEQHSYDDGHDISINNNDVIVTIQMEKLLRYCFDVAFKLPPSGS